MTVLEWLVGGFQFKIFVLELISMILQSKHFLANPVVLGERQENLQNVDLLLQSLTPLIVGHLHFLIGLEFLK